MAKATVLTAARLRELVFYNEHTGQFFWRRPREVGTKRIRDGWRHITIAIAGRQYEAHQLAWLYVTGKWPKNTVDHINTDGWDNKFVNLREATQQQQTWNKRRKNGKFPGVQQSPSGRWRATISHKYLGTFDTFEEAAESYRRAALDLYGEFAHASLATQIFEGSPVRRTLSDVKVGRPNTSGFIGVSKGQRGRWRARYGGKHLGEFETKEEARTARIRHLRSLI